MIIFYSVKISYLYLLYFLKNIEFSVHMIEWDKLILYTGLVHGRNIIAELRTRLVVSLNIALH